MPSERSAVELLAPLAMITIAAWKGTCRREKYQALIRVG